MSSAVLVHANGFRFVFHSLIQWRISTSSQVTVRCGERRSLQVVSPANQHSTRIIHAAVLGKYRRSRGRRSSQFLTAGVLCVAHLSPIS
jgi:hypothetical protein